MRDRLWAGPTFLGDASYAIYLASWVLLRASTPLLRGSGAPALLVPLLGVPAAIAAGALAHVAVERPLLAAFRRRGWATGAGGVGAGVAAGPPRS